MISSLGAPFRGQYGGREAVCGTGFRDLAGRGWKHRQTMDPVMPCGRVGFVGFGSKEQGIQRDSVRADKTAPNKAGNESTCASRAGTSKRIFMRGFAMRGNGRWLVFRWWKYGGF